LAFPHPYLGRIDYLCSRLQNYRKGTIDREYR
jgi:hypothetical protein